MEDIQLWEKIAQNGSIILLMGAVIAWLLKKLKEKEKEVKEKEKEIKELNEYINKNDKENLTVLLSVNNTIDKFIEVHKSLSEKMIDTNKAHNDFITDKFDALKDLIEIKIGYLMDKFNK